MTEQGLGHTRGSSLLLLLFRFSSRRGLRGSAGIGTATTTTATGADLLNLSRAGLSVVIHVSFVLLN
jgi:hypothetical protein